MRIGDVMKNKKKLLLAIFLIYVLYLFLSRIILNKKSANNLEQNNSDNLEQNIAEYQITKDKDWTPIPNVKRASYKIGFSQKLKSKEIKPTIKKIINDLTNEDSSLDEIILYLYSDPELFASSTDIGNVVWAYKGNLGEIGQQQAKKDSRSEYSISYNFLIDDIDEYLNNKTKETSSHGLSENERKNIYFEAYELDKATSEKARNLYPNDFEKELNYYDSFIEENELKIINKFNITKEIYDEIMIESTKERWK